MHVWYILATWILWQVRRNDSHENSWGVIGEQFEHLAGLVCFFEPDEVCRAILCVFHTKL